MSIRSQNFFSTLFLTCLAYFFYTYHPYFIHFFKNQMDLDFFSIHFSTNTLALFDYLLYFYVCGFASVYLFEKDPEIAKSIYCLRGMRRMITKPIVSFFQGIPIEEKIAVLTILVKMFFIPIMLAWLFGHITAFLSNFSALIINSHVYPSFLILFKEKLYWVCFQAILFIDVLFFTLGYLIEHKSLGNKIISIETTFFGWFIALICYPPFNNTLNILAPWSSVDFPYFSNVFCFFFFNILILFFMSLYSWASLALGLKASNLTHRGIVSRGPYRCVRHPAYICKNMAWWIGTLPVFFSAYPNGILAMAKVFLCMGVLTVIYFLRALTEERHLRSVNDDYDAYMKKVPYRFIPGLV